MPYFKISSLYLLLFNSVLVNLSCHNKMPILGGGRLTGIYFLTVLEAKVQIKVPAWSVSGEASLYGLRMAIFLPYPHMAGKEWWASSLVSHIIRALILLWGPHLQNPNYLPKAPHSKTITLGFRVSTDTCGWDGAQFSLHNSVKYLACFL